ncbi:MAG: hypothetical protein JST28_09265 [Acidobacteria bacterium]|nr:hypothetical protein [Acidobacteriota bacterium]
MTIGDFLQYLMGRLKDERPVTTKVGDQDYAVKADGTLGEPIRQLKPQFEKPTFNVATLAGLKGLVDAKLDEFPQEVGLHIATYRQVDLVSLRADEFGRRHVYATALHKVETPFVFDKYYASPEDFLIPFRASFYFDDNAAKVQQLCSAIGSGEAVAVNDDGLSQEVVVKSGTVTKQSIPLPADGVPLIPWRTFREVAPVQSRFLLRMKGVKDGLPQIALFEIDAKWGLDTRNAIAAWLTENIPGVPVIS